MRGYFAIGAEQISKPMNLGNLLRSAHAFGASFAFTIGAHHNAFDSGSDTSRAVEHLPAYHWASLQDMQLPRGCRLVGVELTDDAIELPSFHHPLQAAYVLGPERGSLSPELLSHCAYVVKIPTSFCINVAVAGAIVMYDRMRSLGRFAPRPVSEGAPEQLSSHHLFGRSLIRTKSSV
jgi:tRNA G18 (ribose-2'-O)-methylase SpoU